MLKVQRYKRCDTGGRCGAGEEQYRISQHHRGSVQMALQVEGKVDYRYVSKFLFMIFSCKCCTVIIQEPKEPGELGIRQIKELLLTMVNEIFRCVDN